MNGLFENDNVKVENMKKRKNEYTYYFAIGEVDHDMDDFWNDEENWGIALANSAEWIYVITSNNPITYDDFKNMITNCKKNILNGNSKIFDYPNNDLKKNDIEYLIDYDDIIFEMEDIYGLTISRSYVPLIWGKDCWEYDKNYNEENPPELWRMIIYSYE